MLSSFFWACAEQAAKMPVSGRGLALPGADGTWPLCGCAEDAALFRTAAEEDEASREETAGLTAETGACEGTPLSAPDRGTRSAPQPAAESKRPQAAAGHSLRNKPCVLFRFMQSPLKQKQPAAKAAG
jgi:hypothetical protein